MRGAVEQGEAAVVGRARARHLHDAPTGGPETDALYRQSLHIIRSQSDDRGAILAANDGDILLTNRATYSYMWPRDGALVARALDRAGHADLSRAWLEFSARLVTPDQPYWLHKYSPDGAFGATWHPWFLEGKAILPIQEDETSLTVFAFARHCLETKPEDEWVSRHIDALLHRPCQFMREYRDSATGLPLPSWDLWEERRGVHLYTLASMIAAFRAGAELERSRDTGDSGYDTTADELTQATLAHLVDSETGRFWRCLQNGEPDRTVDAATLSMGLLGALPFEHPSVVATQSAVEDRLRIRSSVDGVARYEHDYYFRKVDHHAGNPWIICTMWLAQAQIRQAKTAEELEACRFWFDWARRRANSTFVLSEQYHPETGEPLSVSPLTWSHAEVVRTCLDYRDQMRGLLA
jgi:GH15 family glucan-1,4-alpha-glucosidase